MQGLIPPVTGPRIAVPTASDPTLTARVVGAKFFRADVPKFDDKEPYRPKAAEWLTSKDNPYFARAAVNRWWHHFFAEGIVTPVDDMGPNHPPSNPELLALLEKEFKASNFSFKQLIRGICNSQAYQRTSRPLLGNKDDRELFRPHEHQAPERHQRSRLDLDSGRATGRDRQEPRPANGLFVTVAPDGCGPTDLLSRHPAVPPANERWAAQGHRHNRQPFCARQEQAGRHRRPLFGTRPYAHRPNEVERMADYVDQTANPSEGYRDIFWC